MDRGGSSSPWIVFFEFWIGFFFFFFGGFMVVELGVVVVVRVCGWGFKQQFGYVLVAGGCDLGLGFWFLFGFRDILFYYVKILF